MTVATHAETGELVKITAVHPVADLFPRLVGEEFDVLVADISRRGLAVPVLVDANGVLLDGRNRLDACEAADVKPSCTTFYDNDPIGMILALNVSRRHLDKGQRAMIAAEARAYSSGISQPQAAASVGVSQPQVAKAAAVIQHAPEMVADVKAGTRPLNDAYAVAKRRKEEQRSREEQDRLIAQRLERLRAAYPDLAAKVDGREYSLPAAEGEARERIEQRKSELASAERMLTQVVTALKPGGRSPEESARRVYADVVDRFDAAELRGSALVLTCIADIAEEATR